MPYTFHFAIVSNSASRLFSTGSLLHLVPLPLCRSLRSSTCRLCGLRVCRAGLCRPCSSKKGSQFAARPVARYRRSQFYNNKNFFKKQAMHFICFAARVRCLSLFLLSYTFTGKFFLCFCLKIFGNFFLKDWEFKGRNETE